MVSENCFTVGEKSETFFVPVSGNPAKDYVYLLVIEECSVNARCVSVQGVIC